MEDAQLLDRHFAGDTLTELAEAEGVNSPETMRQRLIRAKREHITQLGGQLLVATKTGEVLWLAVPSTRGADVAPWLLYLNWVLTELEALTFRVEISVVQKQDGLVIGLVDTSSRGGDQA